jgi:excisionase family DNA binding protein
MGRHRGSGGRESDRARLLDSSHDPSSITHHPPGDELSTREAAIALGRNERIIRRAIARGELPAVKQGSAYRIAADDLLRYAARGKPQSLPSPRGRLVAFPSVPHAVPSLPQPLSSFIGRAAEVATVVALLADPAVRLLTLTGPGGIGKTRLALAVAGAARDRFPDGVVFVPLAAVSRPELVVPAICQTLGLREIAGRDRRVQLHTYLRAKRLLLVIDNVEHLLDAAPEIAEIAARAQGVTLLATSRAPLRVSGEREFPVAPLPLPPAGLPITATTLLASDAARLFIERAQAHDPGFRVTNDAAPLIAEICARLDGLPLAIELAAARAKVLPAPHLRERLERRLPLLTGGDRDAPHRHRTMRDAIAWSYDLLSPDEQRLFRHLAVFAGGFTVGPPVNFGGLGGLGERARDEEPAPSPHPPIPLSPSTLDLIASLIDQSLLVRELAPEGEPRFRMLETIREYGRDQLEGHEAEIVRAAHARYFLALAQALRPLTNTQASRAPLDRLAVDDANLSHALVWLDEQGPAADFVGLVVACWLYWYEMGRLREAEQWLERALTKREAASPPDRARLEIGAGELLMLQGESARADATFAEGVALLRAVDDPFDLTMALISRGALANVSGKHAEAESHLAEALVLAESIADLRLRAAVAGGALANLSVSARGQGDFDRAMARSEEALRHYRGQELDLAETRTLMDLAGIAKDRGDHRQVVERYLACLERTGERGDMRLIADALTGIAGAASAWGQSRAGVLLFAAAAAVRERDGIVMMLPGDVAAVERHLVELREALGDDAFAAAWAEGHALTVPAALAVAATVAPLPGVPPAAPASGRIVLTGREQDVLRLLAAGRTNRDIAEALFIGPRTVSWHVSAILGKLQVTTRRDAVDRARTTGLI